MVSIDTLPDDALLIIFDHHLYGVRKEVLYQWDQNFQKIEKAWQSLVQVCHRWRSIVFESPRQLDLRLVCAGRTPARDRLDVCPTLPLMIRVDVGDSIRNVDNIIAALERTDRVCQIYLSNVGSLDMEMVLAEMQQPFPGLTSLCLWSIDETVPDSFLGGSAPRLEQLVLGHILFPALPKLLLSATQLVTLNLYHIPHSGYLSPDVIATVLSTLTSLNSLCLQFISTRSCPVWATRRPLPSTRPVLPVLTQFVFNGVSEYLEDLVARIDAPQLKYLLITFFNDIVFDTPQLMQFIGRTPKLKALEKADIDLMDNGARVKSLSRDGSYLVVEISCKGLDWQLSSLEQVCTSCLPHLSVVENLYFYGYEDRQACWKDDIDNELCVETITLS